MLTTQKLACILWEELMRDAWGDINPYLIDVVARGNAFELSETEYAKGMQNVLDRVVVRLNKEKK